MCGPEELNFHKIEEVCTVCTENCVNITEFFDVIVLLLFSFVQ